MSIRWVIVAQMQPEPHCPDVYGTWETQEAAKVQLDRWKRRIKRTYGTDDYDGIHMTVEPMYGKDAANFADDFQRRTGMELAR